MNENPEANPKTVVQKFKNGRAIRVKYSIERGFGRLSHFDQVFIVDSTGKLWGNVPTGDYRVGEPGWC